jgi:hypothetical protein
LKCGDFRDEIGKITFKGLTTYAHCPLGSQPSPVHAGGGQARAGCTIACMDSKLIMNLYFYQFKVSEKLLHSDDSGKVRGGVTRKLRAMSGHSPGLEEGLA